MDHTQISEYLQIHWAHWITWIRNPPTTSHMGGVLEQQIKTARWSLNNEALDTLQSMTSKVMSTFSFLFTNNEVKSCYASTWKLLTSRYLLLQMLGKNTAHSKWILWRMVQGFHSDITRTKTVQLRKQRNFQKGDVVLQKANSNSKH